MIFTVKVVTNWYASTVELNNGNGICNLWSESRCLFFWVNYYRNNIITNSTHVQLNITKYNHNLVKKKAPYFRVLFHQFQYLQSPFLLIF